MSTIAVVILVIVVIIAFLFYFSNPDIHMKKYIIKKVKILEEEVEKCRDQKAQGITIEEAYLEDLRERIYDTLKWIAHIKVKPDMAKRLNTLMDAYEKIVQPEIKN